MSVPPIPMGLVRLVTEVEGGGGHVNPFKREDSILAHKLT
jgi:hypothetical protein